MATEKFLDLARREAVHAGLSDARIAVVPHPIGGTEKEQLSRYGARVADEILALLST